MLDQRASREKAFHDQAYESRSRRLLDAFYPASTEISRAYQEAILEGVAGHSVLEYGCGLGSQAFLLAEAGAFVTGIDISSVAIAEARGQATAQGLSIQFIEMNAEQLAFRDGSFDVVCGSSILHHLDLERAVTELRRVLRSGGVAVFVEPLGHNPGINAFRRMTPNLRSQDEHPLHMNDLQSLAGKFASARVRHFYLTALATAPFRSVAVLRAVGGVLEKVDQWIFSILPWFRRFSWQVLVILRK